jgi:DNA (cytosine-5)-methyltransferase 1
MLRVIAEARPSYVLGENVAGIINMELDDVLSALEAQDYATQAFIVPACAVDAKHRRDRVWILGADTMANPASGKLDGGTQRGVAFDGTSEALADANESMRQRQHTSQGSGQSGEQSQKRDDIDGDGKALADAVSKRGRGRNPQRENATDVGQPSSIEGKWEWNPDTDVCRVANGIPNRVHRLRGLGNAIVSQVAEEIIKAIPE